PDGVLSRLGIREPNSPMLVDLDAPAYRDPEAVRAFAAAVLAQDRVRHPGPRGAAWEKYRQDHGLCARLARVIADRAGGNFLVAALAAVHLSEASGVVDPASPGFDPAQIPSGIGEALDKHWEQLPPPRRETERRLLTALAYARGPGLDDDTWLVFAQALGRSDVTITDLDVLRHSASADYLLETLPPGTDGRGPVTRLFHQALADQLLADRNTRQSSDQNRIVDAL